MLEKILLSMLLATAAADDPDSSATKPAAATTQAAGASWETLDGGRVRFVPPEGWIQSKASSTPTRAVYVSDTREGAISIEIPPDMQIGDGTGKVIVKRLQAMRKKAGTAVMEAKAEPDQRFDLRIHEQYKQGSRTADQLHLYKYVGPRVAMVTVNSVSDDEETTKAIHDLGESTLLSATYVKPQKAKPARTSSGAKRR